MAFDMMAFDMIACDLTFDMTLGLAIDSGMYWRRWSAVNKGHSCIKVNIHFSFDMTQHHLFSFDIMYVYCLYTFHSFIHSFVHSFIHSFIRCFISGRVGKIFNHSDSLDKDRFRDTGWVNKNVRRLKKSCSLNIKAMMLKTVLFFIPDMSN